MLITRLISFLLTTDNSFTFHNVAVTLHTVFEIVQVSTFLLSRRRAAQQKGCSAAEGLLSRARAAQQENGCSAGGGLLSRRMASQQEKGCSAGEGLLSRRRASQQEKGCSTGGGLRSLIMTLPGDLSFVFL